MVIKFIDRHQEISYLNNAAPEDKKKKAEEEKAKEEAALPQLYFLNQYFPT